MTDQEFQALSPMWQKLVLSRIQNDGRKLWEFSQNDLAKLKDSVCRVSSLTGKSPDEMRIEEVDSKLREESAALADFRKRIPQRYRTADLEKDFHSPFVMNLFRGQSGVVIGGNDEAAMGAIMALQGAGYKLGGEDGIFVTGFDCNEDASYAIQNGTLGASINPDPVSLGYLGAVFLVQYLNDGTLFPESFVPWPSMEDMSNLIVDSRNIDEYIDTMAWWKIPE